MAATDNTVKMGDPNLGNVFIPEVKSIAAGTSVHWVNADDEAHTVTSNPGTIGCPPSSSENFDSGTVESGQTFDYTFNTPGSFSYHCEIHGCDMKGTIKVT
jgi:plastocyanin